MPSTPNRGYTYPTDSDPATVPADLAIPLTQIDADIQDVVDRVEARETVIATHEGDGTWVLTDGLASPVAVSDLGDGLYSIGA